MGVDVGRWLHCWIDLWDVPGDVNSADMNVQSRCKTLTHLKVQHFEELDRLIRDFGINAVVIDANPERRKAYEFAMRFFGMVKMCFYGNAINGKQIHIAADTAPEPTITVDRTSWLDLSLGRFRSTDMIQIPCDLDMEARAHLKALVRIYEKDSSGQPIGRYVKGNDDDHYAHARNYSELALPFAMSLANPTNISGVY
jgi:hypothetical protein